MKLFLVIKIHLLIFFERHILKLLLDRIYNISHLLLIIVYKI